MAELMDLPVDVLINILLPFPAKLLMQLKTVCKLWCQIICSPNFVHLHFDRTLTLTPSENLNRRFICSCPDLCYADFDTFGNVTELDNPFRKNDSVSLQVVGSCHGLLCLHNYPSDLTIYLYNPTNRTHKKLPFSSTPLCYSYFYYFGFGYDSESKDFKFVRILTPRDELINENEPLWSQVMVYSLRTDSWTRVRDTPHRLSPDRKDAIFVHGNLHWAVTWFDGVNIHHSITSFNLSDNKCDQLPQPPYKEELVVSHVGVLDGFLCVLANDINVTDVWVMKEYGVAKTWTRLYEINRSFSLHLEWPIAFSVDRRELFFQSNFWQVVSLDLETLEIKDVNIPDLCRTHVCVENLMILKDDHERECKRKRKTRRHRRRMARARQCQEVRGN